MTQLAPVLLTVEESLNYPLEGPDALAHWASTSPRGQGYVRMGSPHRVLCVSMFHQLHCLRLLRLAIMEPEHPLGSLAHAHHCLNYIRQVRENP